MKNTKPNNKKKKCKTSIRLYTYGEGIPQPPTPHRVLLSHNHCKKKTSHHSHKAN